MIYVVRHGETDWNLEKRYAGRKDVEINQTGVEQAKKVADKLKDVDFDIVISSPLKRAYKTAEIITEKEKIVDERIIERCSGDFEGKLKIECDGSIDFNDPNENRYNIENINTFRNRIYNFLDEIKEKYKGKNVLVVTHAGVSIYIRCYFEGEPENGNYNKYKLANCEFLMYDND